MPGSSDRGGKVTLSPVCREVTSFCNVPSDVRVTKRKKVNSRIEHREEARPCDRIVQNLPNVRGNNAISWVKDGNNDRWRDLAVSCSLAEACLPPRRAAASVILSVRNPLPLSLRWTISCFSGNLCWLLLCSTILSDSGNDLVYSGMGRIKR